MILGRVVRLVTHLPLAWYRQAGLDFSAPRGRSVCVSVCGVVCGGGRQGE